MKTLAGPFLAIVALMTMLPVCESSFASEDQNKNEQKPSANTSKELSHDALNAASERIRQTGQQIREDIAEARKARQQRLALEAIQEAERKKEAERVREQAQKDAAQLAAAKEAKQRQALEAAQAQARREAAERAAKAEQERQAELAAQRALEEKIAKEQAAKMAGGTGGGGNKLGGEVRYGVDF
jgi:hypothetical protein